MRARRARLGSERGCHEAGWCQPPRARSMEPCVAKCLKRGGACEIGGAPTRRQMHQVMRGPPRLVSMRGGHRVPLCLPPRAPTLSLDGAQILSRFQSTTYIIKFVLVEMNQLVGSNPNVILTRQRCGQRSRRATGSNHRAIVFLFFDAILLS